MQITGPLTAREIASIMKRKGLRNIPTRNQFANMSRYGFIAVGKKFHTTLDARGRAIQSLHTIWGLPKTI